MQRFFDYISRGTIAEGAKLKFARVKTLETCTPRLAAHSVAGAGHHRLKGGGPLRILQVRNPDTRLGLHLLHIGLAGHSLHHRTEFTGLRHAGTSAHGVRGGSVEPGRCHGKRMMS